MGLPLTDHGGFRLARRALHFLVSRMVKHQASHGPWFKSLKMRASQFSNQLSIFA